MKDLYYFVGFICCLIVCNLVVLIINPLLTGFGILIITLINVLLSSCIVINFMKWRVLN